MLRCSSFDSSPREVTSVTPGPCRTCGLGTGLALGRHTALRRENTTKRRMERTLLTLTGLWESSTGRTYSRKSHRQGTLLLPSPRQEANTALREEGNNLNRPLLFASGVEMNAWPLPGQSGRTWQMINTKKTSVQVLVVPWFCRAASEHASTAPTPPAEQEGDSSSLLRLKRPQKLSSPRLKFVPHTNWQSFPFFKLQFASHGEGKKRKEAKLTHPGTHRKRNNLNR